MADFKPDSLIDRITEAGYVYDGHVTHGSVEAIKNLFFAECADQIKKLNPPPKIAPIPGGYGPRRCVFCGHEHHCKKVDKLTAGVLFRLTSFWVGVHYSKREKRVCINLLPCCTVWITLQGGQRP